MAFYVYVYRRSGVPIYVGKGKGERAWAHEMRFSSKPEIVAEFEHETDAYTHEAMLILQYGRVNVGTGTLLNLTAGGGGVMQPTNVWKPPTLVQLNGTLVIGGGAREKRGRRRPDKRTRMSQP